MRLLPKVTSFFRCPDKILVDKVVANKLQKVAVFGCGDLGLAVIERLHEKHIEITAWFDSSVPEGRHKLMGRVVMPACELVKVSPAHVLVASEAYAADIIEQCRKQGYTGRFISLQDLA